MVSKDLSFFAPEEIPSLVASVSWWPSIRNSHQPRRRPVVGDTTGHLGFFLHLGVEFLSHMV